MKVAITGHTRGFGNSLYNIFKSQEHDVLGFSRSNGFDISNNLIREHIVDEIKNFDIFIIRPNYNSKDVKICEFNLKFI